MLENENSEGPILCGLSSGIYPPPHSTHFWGTPYSFSVNGVSKKAPIPHISSTFRKCFHRTPAFCAGKPLILYGESGFPHEMMIYSQTSLIRPWLIQLFANPAKNHLEQIFPYNPTGYD